MLIRRFILVSAAALVVGLFVLAGAVHAGESLWQTDFAAAKAKAKAENKLLLVDFTGSDWCGWCIKLVGEVFSKDAFKTEAPKNFVLVELDYPHTKKQSDDLKKQNKELLAKYKVQGFPTILVMDAEGNVVAKTGYQSGGPDKYVKHLTKFVEAHQDVVKLTAELPKAKGLDRVKVLDKLIDDYKALNNEVDEIPAWDREIVKLDPDNKTGLKVKHEFRVLMADSDAQREKQQLADAKATVDKALALPGITNDQKQDAYTAKCECCFGQGDFVGIVDCAKKGIAVAPGSDQAMQLKEVLDRFKPMAEAQEAIVKLKADLPKVQGLDRAKTLDKLIEAWEKVGGRSRDVSSTQIEKWSGEIVTLDPDNKAKLKTKYEFRNQMADANKLRARPGDYRAAMEKALALPGLGGEQTQLGRFNLAISYLNGGDLKKALDELKKAHDAAPDTQRGQMIKIYIERINQEIAEQVKQEAGAKESKKK